MRVAACISADVILGPLSIATTRCWWSSTLDALLTPPGSDAPANSRQFYESVRRIRRKPTYLRDLRDSGEQEPFARRRKGCSIGRGVRPAVSNVDRDFPAVLDETPRLRYLKQEMDGCGVAAGNRSWSIFALDGGAPLAPRWRRGFRSGAEELSTAAGERFRP